MPCLPAEHRGPVEQHDPLHVGLGAGVEEGVAAHGEVLGRIGLGHRGLDELVGEVALNALEGGAEQVGLVLEVVVQGAAGDPRAPHDLLDADRRVAAPGEQRPRRRHERGARGLGVLRLEALRLAGAQSGIPQSASESSSRTRPSRTSSDSSSSLE